MNKIEKASGPISSPAQDTVLLDTGPLPAGLWSLQFMLSPSASNQLSLEHYAADGVTKLFDHRIYVASDAPCHFRLLWPVQTNERFKIAEKNSGFVGTIAVAVIATG
jgi:hypothetical protein